jgi:hypothetical protein
MSYVTRTTSEQETGKLLYEKITTKGLGKKFLPYISFSSHYNINMLDRYAPFHPSNVHHFARKSDMVRVCGIRTHLDICVTPKSGFRVRIIMMQSNIDWADMAGEDALNNWRWRNGRFPQGGYDPNAQVFTQAHVGEDNAMEVGIHPHCSNLFEFQRQTYNHLQFQDIFHRLPVTHNDVKVIGTKHLRFVNRSNRMRRFRWNDMKSTRTTWKYPYMIHDGKINTPDHPHPDRKVFVLIIASPIFGGAHDPPADFDFGEFDEQPEQDALQRQGPQRAPSILSDAFLEPIPEEVAPVGDDVDMDQSQQRTTRRSAKATGKQKASTSRLEEPPAHDEDNALDVATGVAEGMRRLKRERDLDKIEVNEYGWAYAQSMLYRPTFQIFWKNMPLKRVGKF